MNVEELRNMSLQLPGTTEDIKWETHLCFSVGNKMYLVTSPDSLPSPASFKVSADKFEEIISEEGFEKHAYLGRHYWIHLDDINSLPKKKWQESIEQSYALVAAKLPKKTKKLLGFVESVEFVK